MEEKDVDCYFCGKGAKSLVKSESQNVEVRCLGCPPYELTNITLKSYFEKENKKELLNEQHKKLLIEYLKKNFKPAQYEPVRITTQVIEQVTGLKTPRPS
ncbi:MAG: hypothetical protein GTO17_12590 [Candidatus Aminicenantes bacterium]|nr:hypothetical protein [Candidatus Aminicenantes bacterium]